MPLFKHTPVFAEPPVKTVRLLMRWPQFWKLFYGRQEYAELHIPEWLLEFCAFGDDGVRMIER